MSQFAHPNLSFHQSRRGQNPIFLNHCFTLIYLQRGHASTQPHVEQECSTFCGLAFVANPIHLLADIQKVELGSQRLDT